MNPSNSQFPNRFSKDDDIPNEFNAFFDADAGYGFSLPYQSTLYEGISTNLNPTQTMFETTHMKQPELGSAVPADLLPTATKTMLPPMKNAYNDENNTNLIAGDENEYFKKKVPIIGRQPTFHHYDETNNLNMMERTEMSRDFGVRDYLTMNDFYTSKSNFDGNHFHTDSSITKKRPGRDPYTQPKDVARHFLKVHMKKCLTFALDNTIIARNIIESKIRRNEEINKMTFLILEPKKYFDTLQKDFKTWLTGLRSKFKDYGKEDFKTAYLNDRKAFRNTIMNELDDSNKMEEYLIKKPKTFIVWIFKETFQEISLKFVNDEGPRGLKSQLAASSNILVVEEHFKLIKLMHWLLESPERIETSEVFGKRWVRNFLQNQMEVE